MRRISNEAAALDATCLNLHPPISRQIRHHWPYFPDRHPVRLSHARARIDGIDMIWSYGEGTFIVPDSQIRCIEARR